MTDFNIDSTLEKLKSLYKNKDISFIGSGWTSMAFDVDGTQIIRVPFIGLDQYKKEEELLKYLKDYISVAIPNPKVIETDDISYAIHDKIIGQDWSINSYNKLSTEEKELFCFDIAKFYYEMHSINIENLFDNVNKKDYEPYLLEPLINFQNYLKNDLTPKEIEKFYNWCDNVINKESKKVLIHEDFCPQNSLIDSNHRLTGVFDFANACIGDVHNDFKRLYHKDFLQMLDKVAKHYQELGGEQIDIERAKNLNIANTILCIQALAQNPQLIGSNDDKWQKQISIAKDTLEQIG